MEKHWEPTRQHKKGGLYRVPYDGVFHADGLIFMSFMMTILGEFDDGRFEKLEKSMVTITWVIGEKHIPWFKVEKGNN